MKYSKQDLSTADKMYSEYRLNSQSVKQVANLFGRRLTNKFYMLLAIGCSRYLTQIESNK